MTSIYDKIFAKVPVLKKVVKSEPEPKKTSAPSKQAPTQQQMSKVLSKSSVTRAFYDVPVSKPEPEEEIVKSVTEEAEKGVEKATEEPFKLSIDRTTPAPPSGTVVETPGGPIIYPEGEVAGKSVMGVILRDKVYDIRKLNQDEYRVYQDNQQIGKFKTQREAENWIGREYGYSSAETKPIPSNIPTVLTAENIIGPAGEKIRKFESQPSISPFEEEISKARKDARPVVQPKYGYGTGTMEGMTQETDLITGELKPKTGFERRKEAYVSDMAGRNLEMRLQKGHQIGWQGGKPLVVRESPFQVEHGYTPVDPDFTTELGKIFDDISTTEKSISDISENVPIARENVFNLEESLRMVKDAPDDTMFQIDINNDGVISDDEIFTKNEARKLINRYIHQNKMVLDYEKDLPGYESQRDRLENLKNILQGYKTLGYEMDVTDEGYKFKLPKASEVHEKIYGGFGGVQLTASAFMKSPLAVETLFSIGSEEHKEELSSYSLGLRSSLTNVGTGDYIMKTYLGSPAMVEGVYIPLATMGAGYSLSAGGSAVASKLGGVGTKLGKIGFKLGPTGTKVLSGAKTVTKPFAVAGKVGVKALSTRPGQALFTAGIFTAIEGPELMEAYELEPEYARGKLAGKMFKWGMAIGAFKAGSKAYKVGVAKKPPTEVKRDMFSKDLRILMYESADDETEFLVRGKILFSDQKQPYEVQAFGRAITDPATGESTITFGRGMAGRTRGFFTKISESKVFDFVSLSEQHGEEIVTGSMDDLLTKKGFKTVGYSFARDRSVSTMYVGTGMMETGYEGKVFVNVPTRDLSGRLDLGRLGYKITEEIPSEMGKFVFKGGYRSTSPFKGNILIYGQVATLGPEVETVTISKLPSRSLLQSQTATVSLTGFRPEQEQVISKIMGTVGSKAHLATYTPSTIIPSISGAGIASAPVSGILVAPPNILSTPTTRKVRGRKTTTTRTKSLIGDIPLVPLSANVSLLSPTTKTYEKRDTIIRPRMDILSITKTSTEEQTDLGRRMGFGLGEINLEDITEEQENLGATDVIYDVGTDLGMEQERALLSGLKLKQAQMLKTAQKFQLVTTTVTVPSTPIISPPVSPPFIIGKRDSDKIGRRFKKPKKRRKIKSDSKMFDKGLLADMLSVTKSQARYGVATHPRLTKKIWKIGESTAFTRVPTVELMREKKSKNKRRNKNVLY